MPVTRGRVIICTALALATTGAAAAPMLRLIGLHAADQSVLGAQGDDHAYLSSARIVSADGRYVCFLTPSSNLVASDTNGAYDAFRRDLSTASTVRASVATSGQQGMGAAGDCALTPDGRYLVFSSSASNLVPGVAAGTYNIYLRDLVAQTTELVSAAVGGGGGNAISISPSISDDGRYVAFASAASNLIATDSNDTFDVFVRDRTLGATTRASVTDGRGTQAKDASSSPEISADGRHVLFRSAAPNLVAGDGNAVVDVFVRDLDSGTTERVSVGTAGQEGDGPALTGSISANGRIVAFESHATNLVANDANGANDVFVRDRDAQTTRRISLTDDSLEAEGPSFGPSISGDGRLVAFISYAKLSRADEDGRLDAYLRDTVAGVTTRISVTPSGASGDSHTYVVSLSPNGRYAAFQSDSSNLVTGDSNDRGDVFVRDLVAGVTARASVGDASGPFHVDADSSSRYPVVSGFAAAVAFSSDANNLLPGDSNRSTDVFVRDPATFAIERASVATGGAEADGPSVGSAISRDGSIVAFDSAADDLVAGDDNELPDIFVRDRAAGTTVRIAAFDGGDPDAESGEPAISADGRFVAFTSAATNLTGPAPGTPPYQYEVFVHDRVTGITTRASTDGHGVVGDSDSFTAGISGNGRFVAFTTYAGNLAAGGPEFGLKVVRRDLVTGALELVSAALGGAVADGSSASTPRSLSDDGRFVAFHSDAKNLVVDDSNGATDVFVRDMSLGVTTRESVDLLGAELSGSSLFASISADGRFVAFESDAAALFPEARPYFNVFLHDRRTGANTIVSTDAAGTPGNGISGNSALSPDGRNIAFDSVSNAFHVDEGGQGLYIDTFLARLIEPTTTSLAADPEPSARGAEVRFAVRISGSDTNPRGGSVTVTADTGQTCTTDVLAEGAPTQSLASCVIAISASGSHTVNASYSGSPNYLASSAAAIVHDVVVDTMFSNGFE